MSQIPDVRTDTKAGWSPEWIAAAVMSVMVVALHIYFLGHIGGLWRDEVNSVNLAQGRLANISHDSFPVLMPLLLRLWSELGLGNTDLNLRLFGVLAGLTVTGAFWLAAHWTRRVPPLWSLALVALNSWVIYYAASLRAYGLGSALIAVCAAAAWKFMERPSVKSWLLFAGAVVFSVQTLYQNSALVAAVCAGAWAVCWRRKNLKLASGILLAGLAGAVSLLPYFANVSDMPAGASTLRMDFDHVVVLDNLDTLLAFPLPQFFYVWLTLAAVILVRGAVNLFPAGRDDLAVYAALTFLSGTVMFLVFLRLASFPVQPWYFLPLMALTAVCLESSLPRFGGRCRSLLWGGLAATALISCLFALRILDYRYTNIDLFAKKIASSAHQNDFVVVAPWQNGITFGHYFKGPCAWTTLPPVEDHSRHRYDLLKLQMQNTDAVRPVLERIAGALRSGGTVWVVGGIDDVTGASEPASLPAPPLPHTGWNESPYRSVWKSQMDWFLCRHSQKIECLDPGTNADVNFNERPSFFKASGWREQP
jgi:hypothetical protein